MEIKFLGTGSKGNAIVIQTESPTIMIDCGIPKTQIEKRLIENGINPADIDAIFLTHSHKDHVQGLPLAEKWNIPVFASEGTWKSLKDFPPELKYELDFSNGFRAIGGVFVHYFRTHHNDYDSYGYKIDCDEEGVVSVCLDTGMIDGDMLFAMMNSTHYIIESNHDEDLVRASDYPLSVQERNLSDLGHLSNKQASEALAKLVTGNGEYIYLAHLSSKCNKDTLALNSVQLALAKKGLRMGQHYHLEVV